MKKMAVILALTASLAVGSVSFARGPILGLRGASLGQQDPHLALQPIPMEGPAFAPANAPHYGVPVALVSAPYTNVCYKDVHKIAPCAVPKCVEVRDPCDPCCRTCVAVEVCVPPCACERTHVSRDGRRVKLDYGRYEVVITSARGKVVVDYNR